MTKVTYKHRGICRCEWCDPGVEERELKRQREWKAVRSATLAAVLNGTRKRVRR